MISLNKNLLRFYETRLYKLKTNKFNTYTKLVYKCFQKWQQQRVL